MISDNPLSIKEWKSRFFIVEGNIGSDFHWALASYVKDSETRLELFKHEKKDLVTLRSSRVFSASVLLSKDALFAAGLSSFDPQAERSAFVGQIRKELGKCQRGSSSGERHKSEKKPRSSGHHSKGLRQTSVGRYSSTPKEEVGASATVDEPSLSEGGVAVEEEQVVGGSLEKAVEVSPLQIIVVSDDPEGMPPVCSVISSLGVDQLRSSEAGSLIVSHMGEGETSALIEGAKEVITTIETQMELPEGEPAEVEGEIELTTVIREGFSAGELSPEALGDATEEAEAPIEPIEDGELPAGEEEPLGGGDARTKISPAKAEVSKALQVKVLMEEANESSTGRSSSDQSFGREFPYP